jgi:hypothetical protein
VKSAIADGQRERSGDGHAASNEARIRRADAVPVLAQSARNAPPEGDGASHRTEVFPMSTVNVLQYTAPQRRTLPLGSLLAGLPAELEALLIPTPLSDVEIRWNAVLKRMIRGSELIIESERELAVLHRHSTQAVETLGDYLASQRRRDLQTND